MQEEFDALQRNRTWTLVPRPPRANVITGKSVFRHKTCSDGTLERYKARWVVCGFRRRAGVDFTETFALVVKPGTIRTVLQLAVSRSWPVHQMDVSNAFLHGHLEEQVYCEQPTGFIDASLPGHVCLLSRSLYGLKQAPRAWYQRIAGFLQTLGFSVTRSDASLFVYRHGDTTAYLLLYVDDIILTASSAAILHQITLRLREEFAIKDLGALHYFLVIEVVRRPDGFFLHQQNVSLPTHHHNCTSLPNREYLNLARNFVTSSRETENISTLLALCAFIAVADAQAKAPVDPALPKNSHMIHPGRFGKRDHVISCDDTKDGKNPCVATCDKRCPNECIVMCPGCKTYCLCDFYPGMSCGDPRFTGADGNNFYFHGKKDQDFCVLSDADLHINAHFIGKRNPTMSRDFTWIQALGIRFADHQLYMGAQKTIEWNNDIDRLEMAFDGASIEIPANLGAKWESDIIPGLTVTRTAVTNGVRVQLQGVFDIMAKVLPITEEDSRIHNYGVTKDDSLAHLDIGFKFNNLTDDVHGVLGQTYRSDYVNKLSMTANMPVMGGATRYVSSGIFATDCEVARFGHHVGISMVTAQAN
ncbi:uncharacterized protein [Triticum aestivum]|nr:uncharacterized protein LOC123068070 [Triticum aestivum]